MPTIHVNGVDLYYERRGAGEPVLLVHGLGSSTRDWEPQVQALSPHFSVITVDVRGHGRSSKPPGPYSIAGFADDLTAMMDALALGPAHIVGISMGGMIAFQLAVAVPRLVRTLTIVNSGPGIPVGRSTVRLLVWTRTAIVRLFGMRKMGAVLAPKLFPEAQFASLRAEFIDRWAANDPRAYIAALRCLPTWSVRDRLEEIRCPVLVLAADHDYTSVAFKQEFTRLLPRGELVVIEGARHCMTLERPEPVNAALLAFLLRAPRAMALG